MEHPEALRLPEMAGGNAGLDLVYPMLPNMFGAWLCVICHLRIGGPPSVNEHGARQEFFLEIFLGGRVGQEIGGGKSA